MKFAGNNFVAITKLSTLQAIPALGRFAPFFEVELKANVAQKLFLTGMFVNGEIDVRLVSQDITVVSSATDASTQQLPSFE